MATNVFPALDIKPPAPQENPLDQYSRLLQIKNAQAMAPLQQQLAQQQVQEGQQNLAARQALNAAYSGSITKDADGNPTIDANKLAQGLANGPAAYQTPQVMKGITDFQKSRLDLQTTATELQGKTADLLGSAASAIKGANYDPTLAHSLLDSLPASPQLQQIRGQIDNPQALKQLVDTAIQNSPKQRELQTAQQQADARTLSSQTEANKVTASQNPQSSLYAPTAASVALGTAPGAAQIQQGEARQAAQKAGAESAAKQPYELQLAAQKQALSQGDPRAAGQLLVNGDATLSELKSRGATPDFIAKTLFAANQLSGGKYNAPAADAQYSIAKSATNQAFFGSAKSLTDPGGTLDQLAEVGKTIPQNQMPALNKLADWEKAATGSGPIAKYATIALGVADDGAKVMGGGVATDSGREQILKNIGAQLSPEQRAGALQGMRGSVNSQIASRIGANSVLSRMYGGSVSSAAKSGPPSGATHIVPGSDGKLHYTDGKSDLGVVPQ